MTEETTETAVENLDITEKEVREANGYTNGSGVTDIVSE